MPDDLIPENEPASADVSTEQETPSDIEAANEAAYDEGVADLLKEDQSDDADIPEAESTETEEVETETPEETPATALELSEAEQQILKRAKIEPSQIAGLSRDQVRMWTEILRQNQAEQDALGAQLGRLQQAATQEQQPTPQAKAEPTPMPTDEQITKEVDDLMEKLTESYDEDIKPLGDVLKSYATRAAAAERQMAQTTEYLGAVEMMTDLVSELAMERAFSSLADSYPSLSKSEVRERATNRFWTEWSTGTYADTIAQKGVLAAMQEAASNAAKVLFAGTEKEAVVQLAEKNAHRVAGQPQTPKRKPPASKPKTEDDVYDEAWEKSGLKDAVAEHMGGMIG